MIEMGPSLPDISDRCISLSIKFELGENGLS